MLLNIVLPLFTVVLVNYEVVNPPDQGVNIGNYKVVNNFTHFSLCSLVILSFFMFIPVS